VTERPEPSLLAIMAAMCIVSLLLGLACSTNGAVAPNTDPTGPGEDPCDDPCLGACCKVDGSCVLLTSPECVRQGSDWKGPGTYCNPGICHQPDGACCPDDMTGSCLITSRDRCQRSFNGRWLGPNTACGPVNLCQGACCPAHLPGSCLPRSERYCEGTFMGNGTVCTPNPCRQAMGACCTSHGSCSTTDQAGCLRASGSHWMGAGTACTPTPCVTGACCDRNWCGVKTEAGCRALLPDGTWLGSNTTCHPNRCHELRGACCLPETCQMMFAPDCRDTPVGPGTWMGAGTVCDPWPCPMPGGACCLPHGECVVSPEQPCRRHGAVWLGDGTNCNPNPC